MRILTALEAARAVEQGSATAEQLTRACIERIEQRNGEVRAFVSFDAELALREARRADRLAPGPHLRGVPFAAKDIFDTADHPTEYGSTVYRGHRPLADAACVAGARGQGAVLIGKVASSEFATRTPADTRNPLRLAHTPGGSSSGSAAAVADGMVPVALGSQTTGSIIRPAAYCGIVGYKPTFGLLPSAGMKTLSPSQDTAGVLTRTVADAAFFVYGLLGAQAVLQTSSAPRVGICESSQWQFAHESVVASLERLAGKLEAAGAHVRRIELPANLEALVDIQSRLCSYEARRSLAHEYRVCRPHLSDRLARRLDGAADIDADAHLEMLRQAMKARRDAASLFDDVDVLLYPSADGEAEHGLDDSGSPRFGALWTLLHLPTVGFPIALGRSGLPIGAQVIGAYGDDLRTLAAARFVADLAAGEAAANSSDRTRTAAQVLDA
jgi:amidase